ncbi:type ISP restriction/modification enzyme [Cellulomonas sp. PSBB021]|uniref:DEAD/DEAH box helicase n=1 Tax=Cellulomonas sp. PSBB021 TaxID=2003551 RepID=UPI000B8D74A0|nr:type ISP restriction/modification enzyme [Cellulomonas sp. PSBB021]ASR55826.1 damage-inducible protein [Cellulomonas sp. PSBB021]
MSTLEDVLDQLYFSAVNERDKGDKFERLMLQFFKTDLQWADRFSDVWMWSDWPGRAGRPDTGIDLVATDAVTGEAVAIQCKFYDPTHYLQKEHIDSFLAASGKQPFAQRLIVSTTDKWGRNAEATIEDQQVPVQRLRFMDLAESSIDWSQFDLSTPEVMTLRDRKQLRPHQKAALAKVRAGLAEHDRGKLIMACGTGKTFTSLRIAEDLLPDGGTVLFLVPSISLLSQSLREWSIETVAELRPLAVCSDVKVGKRTRAQSDEDISVVDLAIPATTNATRLHAQLADAQAAAGKLTVVFSTYQSIAVVAEAQSRGLADFDLVICDEAHRTTGATLAGIDESAFVKVHDASFIRASKRLYMTATPRIYDDTSKAKAKSRQAQVVLASMDDEALYGPELHRLGFGEAVSAGLLTDYKVLVLAVDEKSVSRTFQAQMADEHSELKLDDVAKIVGCWNGLAKRGQLETGFSVDPEPMTRAVAFARSIKDSQKFAKMFKGIVADYIAQTGITDSDPDVDHPLVCDVEHVDGTFNVLARNEKLDWLKGELGERECRVLSNARCLSEGVDVPALDAVMFLNPRKSVVDVVQSVGRVMRLAPGKKYGYIILPIGIPADVTPEQALRDNERFAVVWEVLQALRAHDERFDAMVNKIELNRGSDDRIQIIGVGGGDTGDRDGSSDPGGAKAVQGEFVFPDLGEWRESIYAKIVQKVGSRRYWEDWAKDVALIAERHTTRITALLDDPDLPVHDQFDAFLTGLRGNLNDSISRADAIDMLAQHLITRPVFDALFEGYSFAEHNPVSQVMQAMLDTLDAYNLEPENETLAKFYESVRLRAAGIDNAAGKQQIVHELYEKFFKLAFPKTAEAFGIVYTPVQVVDFILRSVEHLLATEFGASLSDEGVHILDPFTGTGSFVVRLLQSGLIRPHDLARKYASEIHANEILLLAYYIAAINIEATYHGVRVAHDPDAGYEPFNGIVLADTFQMTEDGDTLDTAVFPANHERAAHQLDLDIRVIVGNPPYSVGQTSANDNNANLKYPTLDGAIESTYAARSTAKNKNSLYDSYIRAIRWASDRIKDAGIIGFVTNGGFIDSNTADGLRKTLTGEFATIYVYNLRGNQRTAGDLSKREGGKIFDSGSRSTVAVTFLVKKPGHNRPATIHYRDIGDYLSRDEKLDIVASADLALIDWQPITPNDAGDWINQRGSVFVAYRPLGDRGNPAAIFQTYSGGLKTNRDAWVYNSSRASLEANVRGTIRFFNSAIDARAVDEAVGVPTDPARISWGGTIDADFRAGRRLVFEASHVGVASYRPFSKQYVYYDARLNERRYQLPRIFPTPAHENLGIVLTGVSSHYVFTPFMSAQLPDLHLLDTGQFFPRWTFEPCTDDTSMQGAFALDTDSATDVVDGYRRVDNVSPSALADYRSTYGSDVTSDDVFFYVYGLLHSADYRAEFAADLKKMLPRIPKVASVDDFRTFAAAGRALTDLHVDYETVDPYPLAVTGGQPAGPGSADLYEWFRVEKMRWGGTSKTRDRSTIHYNSHITVAGIPDEAHEYLLGSRSGIEWVMERYQVRTDKASGIVNDPNDWSREQGNPRYILDLLARVVTVSVETVRIVRGLPRLDLEALS